MSAVPAVADEYDFVGYRYSEDYQRDYDRGFFFGAEAWFANPRDVEFEPVVQDIAPDGGVLLDVDWDHELTGRFFLGYRANRRVGTFTLSYWGMDETEFRSEPPAGTSATFVPTWADGEHGNFFGTGEDLQHSFFDAGTGIALDFGEFTWEKEFGWGRKFAGWWSASLMGYEIDYGQASLHYENPVFPNPSILINSFSETEAFGGRVGIGGRYWFNDRISMGAGLKVGFASAEIDYTYLDREVVGPTVTTVGRLDRVHTETTSMNFEGDLNFRLRVAGGFELDWGYRYLQFDDAIARDRLTKTNGGGPAQAIEQIRDISFEGPYLGFRYVAGVKKIDSDGDGVLDVYDDCPDTPAGAWVDEMGCPRDLDEDGVYDGIDRCPGTAFGTRVDEWGCGIDSDGDTVPDGLDLCPNTPSCAHVDARGCPKDSDGDGVSDGCDACPQTPAGNAVDALGCTIDLDSDGDTVPDSLDRCPNTARGATVDEFGCEQVVQMMLHFDTDSAEIRGEDKPLLDRIARALRADGGTFEVAGHTDARASVEYNQGLSERRAGSVKDYLVMRGVSSSSLVAVGYSELRPIASNDTERGMALNRRVEIARR